MRVTPFKKSEHLEQINDWWSYNAQRTLDLSSILPQRGFVIEDDFNIYAAGWLYVDAPCAWLEWVVANPFVNKDERRAALDLLVDEMTAYVDGRDELNFMFASLETSPTNELMVRRFKNNSFVEASPHRLFKRG